MEVVSEQYGSWSTEQSGQDPYWSQTQKRSMDNAFEEKSQINSCNLPSDADIEDVSLESRQQSDDSRRRTESDTEEPDRIKIRAKSARDLVKNQEHLLNLLQSMKSDISKMDREANRIKEDIVRSNQLFHVMVKMEKAHHLQRLPGGYNISHSLPRETYKRYRENSRELSFRYLDQLSTFRPRFLSDTGGRSSSLSASSRDYVSYQSYANSSSAPETRRSSRNSSSTEESYSGNSATESEIDSSISRQLSRAESSSSMSQDSDYTNGEEGSSTESVSTQGRHAQVDIARRCSYFYTPRVDTPPQIQSDDVDL